MDFRGDRSARRARNKPMQSCEIVGMLPAEEAAIRRALYASLMSEKKPGDDSPSKTKIVTEPVDDSVEMESNIQSDIILKMEPNDEDLNVIQPNFKTTSGAVEDFIDVDALSSPEISESERDTPSKNFGRLSQAENSCPSSPTSYRSTNSMHLCLSSGTSSWVSFDSSDDSESLSSWNSPPPKRRAFPKANSNKATRSKRTLDFEECEEPRNAGTGKRGRGGKRGRPRLQTARKSAMHVGVPSNSDYQDGRKKLDEGRGDRDTTSQSKDTPYQAQRKFAINHHPPVRLSLSQVKKMSSQKAPPKTEDFITYLCLRGSGQIPSHLKQFESPWTRSRKKGKSKAKNKVQGSASTSKPKQ